MDEARIMEVAGSGLKITLNEMLREFNRSKTPFRFDRDNGWEELEAALHEAVEQAFPNAVNWQHCTILDPLFHDSIIPQEVLVPYLRCNFYCADYIISRVRS